MNERRQEALSRPGELHPQHEFETDRVSGEEKAEYETMVRLLREHSDGGFVYAAPDCPEVYFLSALVHNSIEG